MKIGVLSDSHIPQAAARLPEKVIDILAGMDAIIHTGDFQDASVLETLKSLADFYGVYGNMDPLELRSLLPQQRVVCLGGFKIGMLHGQGAPTGLENRVLTAFADEKVDAICFGHSHQPCNKHKDGILLFNPGSATDIRFAPFKSIGVLHAGETLTGEIIQI